VQARAVFGRRPPPPAPTPGEPQAVAPEAKPAKAVVIGFNVPVTAASLSHLAAETAAAAAGGADEIVWMLSSQGGELLPTLELCRTLETFPVKLKTFAVGQVASAATYLMLAGRERIAHPDATFLFHEVSTQIAVPPGTFVARSVERHRQLFELTGHEIYRKSTQLPPDLIARFAHETIILNAAQALEFGVVHAISESFAEPAAEGPAPASY